jgi:hypothetical protein
VTGDIFSEGFAGDGPLRAARSCSRLLDVTSELASD